ncbi:hypothetical protein [Xenorhabdus ishibashii]|nr:hypothetical protein [Xenorhabdus ishibashii]
MISVKIRQGLVAGTRHYVHLSAEKSTASKVGGTTRQSNYPEH